MKHDETHRSTMFLPVVGWPCGLVFSLVDHPFKRVARWPMSISY